MPFAEVKVHKAHVCELPDPAGYPKGTLIRCTAEIKMPTPRGYSKTWYARCDRIWMSQWTTFTRRAYWT